jgi:hypothetical protein
VEVAVSTTVKLRSNAAGRGGREKNMAIIKLKDDSGLLLNNSYVGKQNSYI